jgi:hypothetical protein
MRNYPQTLKNIEGKTRARKTTHGISKGANTVKPVYNGHPWDPQKVAVAQRWPVFGGFLIKIGIKISLARLRLAVVYRWPLFRGGREHRFDCIY